MSEANEDKFSIRSFRNNDLSACRTLYLAGMLGGNLAGKLADNDTGLDMDDVEAAYMRPGNHFWVAENGSGEIVGMVGVQHFEEGTGEVRRLRVRPDQRRRGIGTALVEQALKFCHEHQYLKVVLDTYMDREPALDLFKKYNFRHDRTRQVGGRDLLVFYLDLYTPVKKPK